MLNEIWPRVEADWEVEIGPGAPVIDALWQGFVDLRRSPDLIDDVVEAANFPALSSALTALNRGTNSCDRGKHSSVWTSKCDLWSLERCDPYEMNSQPEEAIVGVACYLDLLPREDREYRDLGHAEVWSRESIRRLRAVDRFNCRADFVIRQALAGTREGFGITAYISGCGSNSETARQALAAALYLFTSAICGGEIEIERPG